MCLLCVEIQKRNMTTLEVAKAFAEWSINPEDPHLYEIYKKIKENYNEEEIKEQLENEET